METFDCVIIGGGPAGTSAAIAAGRMGARCLLVERHEILGGMGTAALVCVFCPANYDGERFIIGGLFAELRRDLIAAGRVYPNPGGLEAFDPHAWALLLREHCESSGVSLAFGRGVVAAAEVDAGVHVRLDDGSEVMARTVVDCGGQAAVARQLGAATRFGREDGRVMPLTFCYILGGIDMGELRQAIPHAVLRDAGTGEDFVRLGSCPEVDALIAADRRAGLLDIPRDHISAIYGIPGRPGSAFVNFGRVDVTDPGDPAALALAEAAGRRQIEDGVAFLRRRVPGFARAAVVDVARQIGVRESHHLQALHVLSGEEARGCTQFPDAVAQCCYAIDIHIPGSDRTTLNHFAKGTHFDIPWRSLIPDRGSARVVVAGRCLGADHVAASSLRVMPSMAAIGEAGGITAALMARSGEAPVAIGPEPVRARLLATGGILS